MKYVSNIYPITNLKEISSQYRLYDIKGIKGKKDYQALKQILIEKFSRKLKHPVTIIEIQDNPKLVIKNDNEILKKISRENDLGRITVYFELTDEVFDLDFTSSSIETKKICLRFLQFDLNDELRKNPKLWQSETGGPFLLKNSEVIDGIAIFKGFSFRVIQLPDFGFGIIIDATRKFAYSQSLDPYLKKEDFYKKFKGKSFIYKYHPWYEIKVKEYADLNVSQFKIDGITLIDFVRNIVPKPHSSTLANLPSDSVVLEYYTTNGETRGAPAGLLNQVLDFQEINNPEINRNSTIIPQHRFEEIRSYKYNFFNHITFGNKYLILANKTLEIDGKIFTFPDYEMGNNYILKSNNYKNPGDLTRERYNKLINSNVGFYTKTPLQNQIIVLPRSIYDRQGALFINKLKQIVNEMYPSDTYNPVIINYEDKLKKGLDYIEIGNQIVETIKTKYQNYGMAYSVVMIPRMEKKAKKQHDELSALITIQLKRLNITCSIIHTDTVNECFFEGKKDGKIFYDIKPEKRGRFNGYIKNVAITKILLNCSKWPFVLNEPLNADLTIGIDVKNNTAGYTIIEKHGKNIRTILDESSNKEKLSADQLKKFLYDVIKDEVEISNSYLIKKIVIHRDGRLFDTELEGLLSAMKKLKEDDILTQDSTLNILEIPKKSFMSVRFFGIKWNEKEQKPAYENPPNGLHFYLNDEAFLCTTGREFKHDGTSNPLYVKFCYGEMIKEELLMDLFKLTTLAFTKPDDCSRFPLTIKINDIKLNELASDYNEDALKNLLEESNIIINE